MADALIWMSVHASAITNSLVLCLHSSNKTHQTRATCNIELAFANGLDGKWKTSVVHAMFG